MPRHRHIVATQQLMVISLTGWGFQLSRLQEKGPLLRMRTARFQSLQQPEKSPNCCHTDLQLLVLPRSPCPVADPALYSCWRSKVCVSRRRRRKSFSGGRTLANGPAVLLRWRALPDREAMPPPNPIYIRHCCSGKTSSGLDGGQIPSIAFA